MNNEINKRIAHYRKLAGFSQTQVAEMLGLKISTYSQRERVGDISAECLKKLSVILDVSAEILLFGEEKKAEAILPKPKPEPEVKFEPEQNAEPNLTPVLLDRKEKDIITMYRNVRKSKKQEMYESIYYLFKA